MAKRSSEEMENIDVNSIEVTQGNQEVHIKPRTSPRIESSIRWKNQNRPLFNQHHHPRPSSPAVGITSTTDETSVTSKDNGGSLFATFMTDDVFCHMMGFIVSSKGEVDGDTVKSMSAVCTHWHRLVNIPSVWDPSCNSFGDRNHHLLSISQSTDGLPARWRDTTSCGFSKVLIGFRRIDTREVPSLFPDDSIVHRVVERVSNRTYLVRIAKQNSQHEQATMFQHIAYTHQILGDDNHLPLSRASSMHDPSSSDLRKSLLFPLNVELCHESSRMVLWYDDCDESLDDLLGALNFPVEQVKHWCRQLLTAFAILENSCVFPHRSAPIRTRNLFLDKKSSRLRLLVPECRIEDTLNESWASEADAQYVGHICARIAVLGKVGNKRPSTELSTQADLNNSHVAEFVDFLLNDRHRPSISEAMSHSFLSPMTIPLKVSSIVKRKITIEQSIETERRHVRSAEWATLVDWQLEICRVLGENTRVVFRAMSYFDTIIRKTTVSPRHYQLYAGTCLHIASKSFGDRFISARDVSFSADNSFGADEVKSTELVILKQIQWCLAPPTMLGFARAYVTLAELQSSMSPTGDRYSIISHLALETQLYRSYPPSVCGAAAVVVACYMADHRPVWPDELQKETGLTRADLQAPVSTLCADVHRVRETTPNLTMLALFPVPQAIDLQSIL